MLQPAAGLQNVWEIKKTGCLCATTQTPRQYHYNIHEIVFASARTQYFKSCLHKIKQKHPITHTAAKSTKLWIFIVASCYNASCVSRLAHCVVGSTPCLAVGRWCSSRWYTIKQTPYVFDFKWIVTIRIISPTKGVYNIKFVRGCYDCE